MTASSEQPASEGYVNAHTHLYSGLAPFGMPELDPPPKNFLDILERRWWRLDCALDHDILRAAARYYVAEALLAGTTGLCDHHESPNAIEGSLDVLADACEELGMRAVLCYGASERNGGRDEARAGLEECRRFIETNERELVRGVVGLHAAFTVSDETLREAGELARELDTVVHLHVAEDLHDAEHARGLGYGGVLERLLACNALPLGSILAHGVHLAPGEVSACAEHSLWLVQNPRSNVGNAVGYPRALSRSSRVALGTDGYPADMVDEAEMLILQSAAHDEPLASAAARPGAGRHLLAERYAATPCNAVVALGRTRVGSREVARDGHLLTADVSSIRAEARDAAERLWSSIE